MAHSTVRGSPRRYYVLSPDGRQLVERAMNADCSARSGVRPMLRNLQVHAALAARA